MLYIKDEKPEGKADSVGRAAGKGRAGDGVQHSEIQGSGQIRRVGQRIAADGGAAYIERTDGQSIQHMPRAEQRCLWFGEYASTQFSDIVSWEGYDWKSKYPLMEAEFSVKLELADENVTTRLE